MPQLQSLVLTDRKATPVNHTFLPSNINKDGVATVVESNGGIPIGDNRVSLSTVRNSNGRIKATLKFVFPTVLTETINGVSRPTVVRTAYAELTTNFDQTSSEAERNDIMGMVASALAVSKPLVHDTLVKLEGVY